MKLDEYGGTLLIFRRWFTPAAFFLAFFCAAWDSFLYFWYSTAFGEDGPPGAFRWIFIIFPLGHLAVGVGLTYFTLAVFLNRTTIRVEGGTLTVRHVPVPVPGAQTLSTDDLEQIYCRVAHRAGRHPGPTLRYEVVALTRKGGTVKILSGLENEEQALFIEQAVERHLGIEDRPVAGELRT